MVGENNSITLISYDNKKFIVNKQNAITQSQFIKNLSDDLDVDAEQVVEFSYILPTFITGEENEEYPHPLYLTSDILSEIVRYMEHHVEDTNNNIQEKMYAEDGENTRKILNKNINCNDPMFSNIETDESIVKKYTDILNDNVKNLLCDFDYDFIYKNEHIIRDLLMSSNYLGMLNLNSICVAFLAKEMIHKCIKGYKSRKTELRYFFNIHEMKEYVEKEQVEKEQVEKEQVEKEQVKKRTSLTEYYTCVIS